MISVSGSEGTGADDSSCSGALRTARPTTAAMATKEAIAATDAATLSQRGRPSADATERVPPPARRRLAKSDGRWQRAVSSRSASPISSPNLSFCSTILFRCAVPEIGLDEISRQSFSRLEEPVLHRPDRNLRERGDFGYAQSFKVMEDHRLAQRFREPRHTRSDCRRRRIKRKHLRRIGCRIRRLRQFFHENKRIRALPTQIHSAEIEQDAVNPRVKRAPPVILPSLRDHLRKRTENKVFRIRRILRDLARRSQQPIAKLGNQSLRPAFAVKRNLFPYLHSGR